MSRSYKYIACWKDCNTTGMKKLANRKVRRARFTIPSGGAYKKVFCSYTICDYRFIQPYKEWYMKEKYNKQVFSGQEMYRTWYKLYKMK